MLELSTTMRRHTFPWPFIIRRFLTFSISSPFTFVSCPLLNLTFNNFSNSLSSSCSLVLWIASLSSGNNKNSWTRLIDTKTSAMEDTANGQKCNTELYKKLKYEVMMNTFRAVILSAPKYTKVTRLMNIENRETMLKDSNVPRINNVPRMPRISFLKSKWISGRSSGR